MKFLSEILGKVFYSELSKRNIPDEEVLGFALNSWIRLIESFDYIGNVPGTTNQISLKKNLIDYTISVNGETLDRVNLETVFNKLLSCLESPCKKSQNQDLRKTIDLVVKYNFLKIHTPKPDKISEWSNKYNSLAKRHEKKTLVLNKSEVNPSCPRCMSRHIKNNVYVPCICLFGTENLIKTQFTGNLYILEISPEVDSKTYDKLLKSLKK